MLNDSLHSKNFAARSLQTLQSFMQIINEQKANKINGFEEGDMRRIYDSIQKASLNDASAKSSCMQASQADTKIIEKRKQPTSYSKYGKANSGSQNDIIDASGKWNS